MAKIRPDNRKSNSEASQVDAEVHLQLQHATAEAIRNVRAAAQESVRAERDATERALSNISILEKKLASVQAQADLVEQRLKVSEEELIRTRRENEELRTALSVERRQLLEQMGQERAEHQAAMHQMKIQMQQMRVDQASSSTGVVINPGDFGVV